MVIIKLGVCGSIEDAVVVKEAGYDFLECSVVSLVPEDDQKFDAIFEKYKQSPIPVEACNMLLPGHLHVTGPNVDFRQLEMYIKKALKRVHAIGADTIVFGSGGARSYPNGFSKGDAEVQIIRFLQMVANIAEPLGITIVIEPLNKKESNIITSVPEAVALAEKLNHPSIKVLADLYHMMEEEEPIENIESAGRYLQHIHVADIGRLAPGTGNYPYDVLKEHIVKAGYDKRISIECEWEDFPGDVKLAKIYLERIFT
ncbi:sugar phosphate isomerase/epimerase family protein [Gracilibacillus kekensis]|uniref:Sugar phosphate isomerase/epimerase n=1 Tax=Gracilibacillus kekensis TaxID=1027249 RepID=A0A1M7JU77_9BACI|nr:sugar phosphate isomerase/epimerase family protein [Gracilibacillus kekensis]SHM56576.1 Sugar phosphate isomerase/epimerase [Gracilibacillus kekensis]